MSKENIDVIDIPSTIEILPVVLEINKEAFLLVIVHQEPGPVGPFIDKFILLMNDLPIQHRILIVSDFNLDQILPENVANIAALIQNFDLSQRSQYSIQIRGGYWILYLILSISIVPQFYLHPTLIMFFFPNLRAIYDLYLHCQHYPNDTAHYITMSILSVSLKWNWSKIVKIFEVIFLFFSLRILHRSSLID